MFDAGVSKEVAVKKVNEKFGEIFYKDNDGIVKASVCLVCDRMLHVNGVRWIHRERLKLIKNLFKPVQSVRSEVERCYKCTGEGYETHMAKLVLSPRGCYDSRRKSFAMCVECNSSCTVTRRAREGFFAHVLINFVRFAK